jgi:hypothetical protein
MKNEELRMSPNSVSLFVLLAALGVGTAPAAGQRSVQELSPGTSYTVGTNGQFYVSTNIDEVWPGVWKETTNGLRIQLYCWATNTAQPWVSISVGSVVFNSGASFVGPPSGKFAKFELRDADGVIVPPKRGVVMEGELLRRISIKELPRWPYGDHGLRNHLVWVTNGAPAQLQELKITDVCRVQKEGDYSLTVCAVVYKFGGNWDYLDRLDLPPVTTRIHLTP